MRLSQINSIEGTDEPSNRYSNNKRCFSANGFSLLPLALQPRLFSFFIVIAGLAIGLFACSNSTFAVEPFLNVTIANSISLDLKPVSTSGTFAKSDTTSNIISVNTNYFAGYTLGIAASNSGADAANLVQTSGAGNEQTIVGRISSIGIVSGVTSNGISEGEFSNEANTQYKDTWGLKLTNLNTSESGNYLPAPTDTTAVALGTTSEANPTTANNYNIAIGARVGTDIPKGSYTNTFVIQVVANPIPYEITFNKGNAEEGAVSNLPTNVSGSTNDTTVTLPNTVPTRASRKFLGWCSTTTTTGENNADICSGTVYNPNGDGTNLAYTLNQTTSNANITLYAMWRPYMVTWENNYSGTNLPANTTTIINGSISTLPTPTKPNTKCGSGDNDYCVDSFKEWNTSADGAGDTVTTGTTLTDDVTYYAIWNFNTNTLQATTNTSTSCNGTKYDARDGKAYGVNYIASGNSNFCFILSNLAIASGTTLKTGDSDIKAGGVTYTDPTTNQSVTKTSFTLPTEEWTSSAQNYYCKAIMAVVSDEYYYNWYAAIANPYQCLDPTTSTNATTTNDSYTLGSICPAGWKLLEHSTGDLQINNSAFRTALSNYGALSATGYFYSGARNYVGDRGFWWSNARYRDSYAYSLYFYGTGIASVYSDKYFGFYVRCTKSS